MALCHPWPPSGVVRPVPYATPCLPQVSYAWRKEQLDEIKTQRDRAIEKETAALARVEVLEAEVAVSRQRVAAASEAFVSSSQHQEEVASTREAMEALQGQVAGLTAELEEMQESNDVCGRTIEQLREEVYDLRHGGGAGEATAGATGLASHDGPEVLEVKYHIEGTLEEFGEAAQQGFLQQYIEEMGLQDGEVRIAGLAAGSVALALEVQHRELDQVHTRILALGMGPVAGYTVLKAPEMARVKGPGAAGGSHEDMIRRLEVEKREALEQIKELEEENEELSARSERAYEVDHTELKAQIQAHTPCTHPAWPCTYAVNTLLRASTAK